MAYFLQFQTLFRPFRLQDPPTNILLSIFSLKIETGSLKFMHNAKKHIQNPVIEGGEGGGKGMG